MQMVLGKMSKLYDQRQDEDISSNEDISSEEDSLKPRYA